MRWRVGLLLCLFAIIAAVGCRKALAPNIDRNKAPETWITAAPLDTITREKGKAPETGTVPVRFHVYWAGSDQDGAVTGYYWAVVETLPPQGGARPPQLPGPRASDYRFTTRSDSTFVFSVHEKQPDRQHAFFVYSVDNEGKPDPTPARFIFNAEDRFTPLAVFDQARATGTVYFFENGVLKSAVRTFDIRDSLTLRPFANDTVPAGSRLTFRFHAEPRPPGLAVKGFRYKLDESELQPSGSDSFYTKNIVEYRVPAAERDPARNGLDTIPIAPGDKIFTLRAVDVAGGGGLPDFTRRFQVNFSPETWYAGPDTLIADLDAANPSGIWKRNPDKPEIRYALMRDVRNNGPAGLPGTLLSADSSIILPAARKPNRTFLEIWGDTIYLRREFDTVHLGSWVLIHNGGFDRDSKYSVNVADGIEILMPPPQFPGGPVLERGDPNGSPIGFRTRVSTLLTGTGLLSFTAQSKLYPAYDPNDSRHFPRIGAYHPMFSAGEAYSLQRAEDADGARDNRVDDARNLVRDNPNSPLRALVMVFYVDYPPEFKFTPGLSVPASTTPLETVFNSREWALRVFSIDGDPYVSGAPYGGPPPGGDPPRTVRLRFTVTGQNSAGQPVVFKDPAPTAPSQQKYVNVTEVFLNVPEELAPGPCTLTIELCDCSFCESTGGEGRCVTRSFEVLYQPTVRTTPATTGRPGQH